MHFSSTRDKLGNRVGASEAIVAGLAPDGGLYVPGEFPRLGDFVGKPYDEIAFGVLRLFLTDFSGEELRKQIHAAYDGCLPVKSNGGYLELFHGRTSAFKDVALQLFPHLLTSALAKNGVRQTAVVLVATSGDTGSAVLAGMADVPGTRAIVFYPENGVSRTQRLQMTTRAGANLHVFGIKGNFDDAQTAVKNIFEDKVFRAEFADKYVFTSANSINLGRLLPQIAYYFHAYSELVRKGEIEGGDEINFVVPTGNFGNILAGWYAKKTGLPVGKLVCATNSNNVLYDFIKTGVYNKNRAFQTTISPSMDILVSSNLERLVYDAGGCGAVVAAYTSLRETGLFKYEQLPDTFDADFATDEETMETIRRVYHDDGTVLDPHTAVGKCVCEKYKQRTGDDTRTVVLATASPHKFAETVGRALGCGCVPGETPDNLRDLETKPVLHGGVTDDIGEEIRNVLNKNR